MSRISEVFEYMRQCPVLNDLWSIGTTENVETAVILPQGASESVQYNEQINVCGDYQCEIIPYPSVYEDYQINCFKFYDANDSSAPTGNINVISYEEVQKVCDWILEQEENNNLPDITGEKVVSIEVNPFVPQLQYVDVEKNVIAYFITLRIRYVNKRKRKTKTYAG